MVETLHQRQAGEASNNRECQRTHRDTHYDEGEGGEAQKGCEERAQPHRMRRRGAAERRLVKAEVNAELSLLPCGRRMSASAALSGSIPGGAVWTLARATDISSLPADVIIVLLLRRLPLAPRVRVLSRLNRHWHELVYRSIDTVDCAALTASASFMEMLALGRLPSLTSLKLNTGYLPQLCLPSLLRDLELRGTSVELPRPPLPPLTSLTALLPGQADCAVAALLRAAASSLRRVHIDAAHVSVSLKVALKAVHLPRLTDLSVSCLAEAGIAHVTLLFRRHASQLQTLSLHKGPHALHLAETPLPELLSLLWDLPFPMSAGTLEALHSCAPKLTALHHLSGLPPSTPSDCERTLLRTLWIATSEIDLPEKLRKFPNLTDLSVGNLLPQHAKPFADGCAHLLTECRLRATRPTLYQLACYSRLRTLHLIIDDYYNLYLPPLPALTNLTELHTNTVSHEAGEAVRHFLRFCPALAAITVRNLSAEHFAPLLSLVTVLDRRGAHALIARNCPPRWPELFTRRRLRWLTLRITTEET